MADEGIQVGGLYYDLDIRDDKLKDQLDADDKAVKDFGDSVNKTSEKLSDNLSKAAKGFAIVGAGLTVVSKQATDFTVDLVKESKNLGRLIGVSTEEASRLTAAFNRLGIDAGSASQMFGIFSKNIVAATESADTNRLATEKLRLQIQQTKSEIAETNKQINQSGDKSGELNAQLKVLNNTLETQEANLKKSSDGFAKLGISTKDANGNQKSFNTLLFEVADRFKTMPDGIDKTAIALELFGRSGKDMIKVLNLGGDGIKQLEEDADRLGLTLSTETIAKVNDYIQSTKDLKQNTDALKIAIGTATTPVLTSFQSGLNDLVGSLIQTDGFVKTLTVSVLAFGGPVLAGAAAVLQLTANLVQAWPAITAVTGALTSMTALTIAGWAALIIADLFLVKMALDSVRAAFDAVANAEQAANDLAPEFRMRELQQQATAARARGDKAEVDRIARALSAFGGNAGGTDNWKGGLTWVHEKGPEIIDLPRGTRIIPHELSKEMVKSGSATGVGGGKIVINIGTVQDRSDAEYIIERINRSQERLNMGMSPI